MPYLVIDRSVEPAVYLTFGQWPQWAETIIPTPSPEGR